MPDILLIEDDPDVRTVIENALVAQGHRVQAACDATEGMELLGASQFDLLITDIVMPGAGGLRAIETALCMRPELRILAISGGSSRLGSLDCLMLAEGVGAHQVLGKPFRRNELSEAVAAALSS